MPEHITAPLTGAACAPDGAGHCITCSDEALEVEVLEVDQAAGLALVAVGGMTAEVDISFVDPVEPGDRLLVHGGVALARC